MPNPSSPKLMKIWIIDDFYKIINYLRLPAAKNSIIPDVVVQGDNDVIFIVVGIVVVDSICLVVVVVVVFCIEDSVCIVVGVVVIIVADVEVIVDVVVV